MREFGEKRATMLLAAAARSGGMGIGVMEEEYVWGRRKGKTSGKDVGGSRTILPHAFPPRCSRTYSAVVLTSLAVRLPQLRMTVAVREIDHDPDAEPDHEPDPSRHRQRDHQIQRRE